jgi:hypothetical protein
MDTERIKGRQGITLINDLSFPRRWLLVFPFGLLSHTVTTVNTIMPNDPPSTHDVKNVRMGLETRITIILSSYVEAFLLPSKSRQPIFFLMENAFIQKGIRLIYSHF